MTKEPESGRKSVLRRFGHHLVRKLSQGAPMVPIERVPGALARRDVVLVQPSGVRNRHRVLKVAQSLLDDGLSVAFVTKLPPSATGTKVLVDHVLGCPVLNFPDAHCFLGAARTRVPALNWQLMVLYLQAASWHYVRQIRPRVVHSFGAAAISLGHDWRDRLRAEGHEAAWFHDFLEYTAGHEFRDDRVAAAEPDREWHRTVVEHEARHAVHADHLFTVSERLAELLQADYALPARPSVLLNAPRFADTSMESESPGVRRGLGLPSDTPLLVYSGGVSPLRGIHVLMSALAKLPDMHLALITNAATPYLESLMRAATAGGYRDRIHLLPYLDPHLVPGFLREADVGVHPLTRYGNADVALPNKLFDYLHAGLPMVVSDCTAMAGFVREHRLGEVFPADDAEALAAALRRTLAAAPAIRARISEQMLREHSWERQHRILSDVYRSALRSANGASSRSPAKVPLRIVGD